MAYISHRKILCPIYAYLNINRPSSKTYAGLVMENLIALKGKDKHDTRTLRLTFCYTAVFYQVDFLCVCCHSKMTSFLSAWGHF